MSQCCKNYLCHFCADDIKQRELKVQEFVARCPYSCNEGKFELADVVIESDDELR